MAIDRKRTEEFIEGINSLFEQVLGDIDSKKKDFFIKSLMGPAIEEIKKLTLESRPPRMFVIGRSGHGKSSLINALAKKTVCPIDHTRPKTYEANIYKIIFEEQFTSWEIVDSRGLFEIVTPIDKPLNTTEVHTALDQVKKDIMKHKPDLILHIISATELRSSKNDFDTFKNIYKDIKNSGIKVPIILILNKIDTLDNPRQWPPEKNPRKAGLIDDLLKFCLRDVLKIEDKNIKVIDPSKSINGYSTNSEDDYIGVIPLCSLFDEPWNINTLEEFIGKTLPESALLDFFQALKRKDLLKKISSSIIKRFSTIAGGIGAIPIPFADIFILVPLQIALISIIGGLSCRKMNKETAYEYFGAVGVAFGGGVLFRTAARQVIKFIPGVGSVISAGVASSGTYALGKSAELYFFKNELKKPKDIKEKLEDK